MKLKFKHQAFQTRAVEAVVDCFKDQPNTEGISYRIDPGTSKSGQLSLEHFLEKIGFKNADLALTEQQILENIQAVQRNQNLPQSQSINEFKTIRRNEFIFDKTYTKKALAISLYHLDVEMETGTEKTYVYI